MEKLTFEEVKQMVKDFFLKGETPDGSFAMCNWATEQGYNDHQAYFAAGLLVGYRLAEEKLLEEIDQEAHCKFEVLQGHAI